MKGPFVTTTGKPSWIEPSHLREQLDAALIKPPLTREAMLEERDVAKRDGRLVSFYAGMHLSRFNDVYQPGDEVWEFNDIENLSGSAGYCLIRGNTVVGVIKTMLS
ncbi:MAG: hypothetical protein EOO77_21280 [Oxalobacteraceae bacterium]|nr:MAG: hypothetical protein EOO77_21280 [Oxalobacteraceae bacterium]